MHKTLLPKGVYLLPNCELGKPRYVNRENFDKYKAELDFLSDSDFNNVLPSLSQAESIDKGAKYMVLMRNRRTGETIMVDIYDVLEAFKITCSAMAHALKKLLMPGKRGAKSYDKDCDEAINSVEQSKLLQKFRK